MQNINFKIAVIINRARNVLTLPLWNNIEEEVTYATINNSIYGAIQNSVDESVGKSVERSLNESN